MNNNSLINNRIRRNTLGFGMNFQNSFNALRNRRTNFLTNGSGFRNALPLLSNNQLRNRGLLPPPFRPNNTFINTAFRSQNPNRFFNGFQNRPNQNQGNNGPRSMNPYNLANFPVNSFTNGGVYAPSIARSTTTFAPAASGFSLSNNGERNVTFSKEYVASFLTIAPNNDSFIAQQITTHPFANPTTAAIARLYARYKILSYQFKYKAACPTTAPGLHFTGVDYGMQTRVPANYEEVQGLEHFSVGPVWKDSQDWHTLKLSNLKERWFECKANSSDPESRPARIFIGGLGLEVPTRGEITMGVLEVKVNYLFNGLTQNFTGLPPQQALPTITHVDYGLPIEVTDQEEMSEPSIIDS